MTTKKIVNNVSGPSLAEGQYFSLGDDLYILSMVALNRYALISLKNGNRYAEPTPKDTLFEVFNGHQYDFTYVRSVTITVE